MNTLKKISIEMVLPLITAWFFMTVLVDIFTIPVVFRNSSSIIDAGKIGMTVFGRFNIFELIFSILILSGCYFNWRTNCNGKWAWFAIPLFILALVYNFYMTPMITNTTFEIHATSLQDPLYAELQSRHALFHNLYRKFDSAKLLFLIAFGGRVLYDKVKAKSAAVCA